MILENMIANIRTELQDNPVAGADPFYNEDTLIRAIDKSVGLMSRLIPKRTMIDITLTAGMISGDYIVDISTTLPDYIKIEKIEYPADETVKAFPTFDIIDHYVVFRGNVSLTVGDIMRVVYLSKWIPPTFTDDGDYPSHLDDPIIIGASGQALIFKAEYYTKLAGDSVVKISTAITSLSALTQEVTTITVPTINPVLTGFTAVLSETYPVAPTIPVLGATPALTVPTAPTLDYTTADAAIALIDAVTTGDLALARTYLSTGAPFINDSTYGDNVGEIYGQYGQVEATIAGVHNNEAVARLRKIEAQISLYQQQVYAYESAATIWSANVNALVNNYQLELQKTNLTINAYLAKVEGYKAEMQGESVIVAHNDVDAKNYAAQISKYQADISLFAAKINLYINLMGQESSESDRYLAVAGRYLASGQAKINEMLISFGFKPEFRTQSASSEQRT
jgi:hypothetical protein